MATKTTATKNDVLASARDNFRKYQETLADLVRIPSVSAPDFDIKHVIESADACVEILNHAGLENVRQVSIDDSHPSVIGEWAHQPGKPTVLLYAHHDVQPPGVAERWLSDPFDPVVRDGRMYGRGSADDKAGAIAHAATIRAWLDTAGELPVNVKVIIEGEEEIGSPNLEALLHRHSHELRSDVMVLADAMNWSAGVPSITCSLRGITEATVTLRSLGNPAHSGLAGGVVPDPVMGMAKLLSTLTDEHGDIAVEDFWADVRKPSENELTRLRALPEANDTFRADFDVQEGVSLCGDPGSHLLERLWYRPSLTVIGFDSHPIVGSSNQIVAACSARISVRLAPGQDPEKAIKRLETHLRSHIPWNLKFEFVPWTGVPAWFVDPEGPAFEAAEEAFTAGFGREPVYMGMGGSIPFAGPFAAAFGGVPTLLVAAADPTSRIHSENESVELEDVLKLIESEIHFLDKVSTSVIASPGL